MSTQAATLEAVTVWAMSLESGYRSPVPAMPRNERDELVRLHREGARTDTDRAMLAALRRKLSFRAAREVP